MGAHILPPLAVNSISAQKVDSLPLLGLEPATFGMQAQLSDRSLKSHLHTSASQTQSQYYSPYSPIFQE
jgi:hypothetical protein